MENIEKNEALKNEFTQMLSGQVSTSPKNLSGAIFSEGIKLVGCTTCKSVFLQA
jgi:hypothetical protein